MPAQVAGANKDEIHKCKNFLETLIRLSSQQPQQTLDNVKRLIQGLLVSLSGQRYRDPTITSCDEQRVAPFLSPVAHYPWLLYPPPWQLMLVG